MQRNLPYQVLENYCMRTPMFSLSSYLEFMSSEKVHNEAFHSLLDDPLFSEALYLASPNLHKQIDKWKNLNINDSKKLDKLKATVLKYYTRMSSRCTPFGLFAACSMGNFAESTQVTLSSMDQYSRASRFDMGYMASLSRVIQETYANCHDLILFSNNSIYKVHDHFRYLEYQTERLKRKYSLEGVAFSRSLSQVLKMAAKGASKLSLAKELVDKEITLQEALNYIDLLVENQLLVSELDLVIIGDDNLIEIDRQLKCIKKDSEWSKSLQELKEGLKQLDNNIVGNLEVYKQLAGKATSFVKESNHKHLFQTNVYACHTSNHLNKDIKRQIEVGLDTLKRLSYLKSNPMLEEFKASFRERYDTAEVALTEALDTEFGIGYGTMPDHQDFLQDLSRSDSQRNSQHIQWTPLDAMMQTKLFTAISENQQEIVLTDADINKLSKSDEKPVPDSFSSLIEVYDSKIYLSGFTGSSAINLLGRFCHGSPEILEHVEHIARLESEMNPGYIVAEINHLPEDRTGNVLHRPAFREYEIPYLTRSTSEPSKQLRVDDLYLSIKEGKLVLRSKKHNKTVLTRMGNAHNYQLSNLPIYRFLCDLQTEGVQSAIGFSWNAIYHETMFLPRVTYKDIILSKARWNIDTKVFLNLLKARQPRQGLAEWKNKHQLPNYVQLVEGDNLLLICLTSLSSIEMLADAVKGKKRFILEEFLFANLGSPVKNCDNKIYCNQFIVSLYNHQKWQHARKNKN